MIAIGKNPQGCESTEGRQECFSEVSISFGASLYHWWCWSCS